MKLTPVLAVSLLILISQQEVSAQSLIVGNCTVFTNLFFDNEPVCVTGTTAGNPIFSPDALACVLPSTGGLPEDDVTPGGCNTFPPAFTMLDEPIWLPITVPGNYLVVLYPSVGSPIVTAILITSSGGGAPTVDVDQIKMDAGKAADEWEKTANFGENISNSDAAESLGNAAASDDFVSFAGAVGGFVSGKASSYNQAVLEKGGQIIATLARSQQSMYETLEADPPDPMFTDFAPIDIAAINAVIAMQAPLNPLVPLNYPFGNLSQDPLQLAMTRLANSMTMESAIGAALIHALEKYQGAEAAADDEYMLLQARLLKRYADMIMTQLAATRQGALDYKAELTADGLAAIVYDGAEISALIARIVATGLTAAEEQSLRDVGFVDEDLTVMTNRLNSLIAPTGMYSLGGGLDNIVAAVDLLTAAFTDLSSQAQDIVDFYAPLVTEQHPLANAGGPYMGSEGVQVNFDASASTDPQAQAMTVEWDFDLDGQFDDAAGVMAGNTWNAPLATQVGVRITDTDGNMDIAYATVSIAEVNGPPEITSFAPVELLPTASNLYPLEFSATATDPDLDAVTYEWKLNGVVMSTSSDWTYTPGLNESGLRTVRLTVSDSNPLSEDTLDTRLVKVIDEGRVDVTGFSDANGDMVPDLASFIRGSGPQPQAELLSGADGTNFGTLSFLNPAWEGIAIDTVEDSNGDNVADDPGVAMLLIDPTTNKMLVQVRVAATGANVNKINFLNPDWAPVDVVVFNDPNGDGDTSDTSIGVMAVNRTTGKILIQVRALSNGAKTATRSFLNLNYTPVAAASADRAGLPSILGVLGVETATGKILVQTRQLDNGALQDNQKFLSTEWTAKDIARVKDGDSNGTADDPGWLVLATNNSVGNTLVQARDAATGARLKNLGYLTPDYEPQRIATSADIDGNGREEASVLAKRLSDDQRIVQVRDFAAGSRTINIFP